ncbi:hypothetical protein LOTGIDRAFT_153519 [Lottia gigantea]|uniref:Uncharacterized protein n=1 Tax=Lottia gigantea TaxID=225164 RepID=V3ZRI9_LOTGI|nr:hypothetical protein LOTGIDRAFT_153519 [Lottia gigantea]ESO94038.1 hypothetical protein LOTGIDRAFT_153519 [Lottia gigantea]
MPPDAGLDKLFCKMIWLFTCCIGLLLITVSIQSNSNVCVKSFQPAETLPDGEFMKVLYHADFDPATGKLRLRWRGNTVTSDLSGSTLSFQSWLAQPHDVKKSIGNLWSFLTRIIVSELEEGLAHFKISAELGASKPDGIVDISKLQMDFFQPACTNYNSKSTTWPYNCLDKEFFCDMNVALTHLILLLHDGNSLKTKSSLNQMSILGVDSTVRSEALELFFTENILDFIPARIQENVFYHSRLSWECNMKLASPSTISNWITTSHLNNVKTTVTTRCNQHTNDPIGIMYYCKVKDYILKFESCNNQDDTKPCLYDVTFQETFTKGWLIPFMAVQSMYFLSRITRDVMQEFKTEVLEEDRNGLLQLYNKYNPHITVEDSMCVIDWPKAYYCKYTECKEDWVYRPDCVIKLLLPAVKRLTDVSAINSWTSQEVQKAKSDLIIWMSHHPFCYYMNDGFELSVIDPIIVSTQSKIKAYVEQFDMENLKTFVATLPSLNYYPKELEVYVCSGTVHVRYYGFCILEPLLTSVSLFINVFDNSKNSNTKVLNPTVDYKTVLEQLQLDVASTSIHSQNEAYFNQLTGQLQNNFGTLSTYFASLADYDKDKAEADIAYIDGRLNLYKSKINNVTEVASDMFQNIFQAAFENNVLEISGRLLSLGIALVQIANPASTLLGGSSFMDLMDSINELAQTGVVTAQLIQLQQDAFPDLIQHATRLGEGFLSNENQLLDAKKLIDALKYGHDATTTAGTFLGKYNGYDPKIVAADISSYGAKLETITEVMCEAAFAGGTAISAVGEIIFATKGDCVKVHGPISELIALCEEVYEYQFDLMDALSDTSRAYLAEQKANDLKLVYSSNHAVDQAFLQKFAINSFIISTLNLWELITEYCDVLTYTRGGRVQDKCTSALNNPSHRAISQVIGHRPTPLCHVNNEITHYVSIPITPSNPQDQAYLDLNELYSKKTITFKVPNFQWLVDSRWLEQHDAEKAMYIARFEIYLPPMTSHHLNTIEVNVEPSMENFLRYGGIKYLIPVTGYSARYTENSFNCYTVKRDNPYQLCDAPGKNLIKICLTSEGFVDRLVQPSIYNEWKITLKTLPADHTVPQPATDFKIQAGITLCLIDRHGSGKKRESPIDEEPGSTVRRTKRDEQHCCNSNQYWSSTEWACRTCPSGTTLRDKGYYCQ